MKIVKYHDQDIEVREGDIVEYKPLITFWKRKKGRVSYVPGISKFSSEMEHGGLTWLGISGEDGTFRGIFIDPDNNRINKGVVFIARCEDKNYFTPEDIEEDEW